MLTIFGFYTSDFVYKKHAEILKLSAKKFGIDILLYEYEHNDWQSIIQFKPSFISKMRKELSGPILYVDVDAIILKDIREYFINIEDDIAVHYLNDSELLSGTLFINDTAGAYSLIEEWESTMLKCPDIWDQIVLDKIILERVSNKKLKVKRIPEEYTYIFDCGNENVEPIIEHFQASRDAAWVKKYKSKKLFSKLLFMKSKSTKNLLARHKAINQRTTSLELNIEFSFLDLLKSL